MDPDPFGRLPWFVLQKVLSNLPGLPALHSLYKASPEVAGFLHQNNEVFARIVDSIIDNPVRERGLAPHVQDTIRLIILVWTRTQEPETDILGILHFARERPREWPPMLKTISPLTPSAILCRLLRLMVRLRCLIHAYFHSTITRCLRLQLEHLPRKTLFYTTRPVVDLSRRPKGISSTPVDIGPPTWAEEQRLLSSFLCIVLFYELRKTHLECSLVTGDSESTRALLDNNVQGFWEKAFWTRATEGQEEQIATLLHWLDRQADGRENIYAWLLSDAQMHDSTIIENDLNSGRSSRGMRCLWSCKHDLWSPLKGVDYSIFRPYGLVFWDGVRMDGLGWPDRGVSHRIWFAWSSIFTKEDWEEFQRRQSTISAAAQVQV